MTKLCAVDSSLAVTPRQRVMKDWAASAEGVVMVNGMIQR
jgi:hypothetical protein